MSALACDEVGAPDPAVATVAVVMVVRAEPIARVQRAIDALAAQQRVDAFAVVIAAPPEEHGALRALRPHGAVGSIRLVANPGGARSAGLNAAVEATTAAVVVRTDARASLPSDYVTRCLARLASDASIGVVGGVQWPVAARIDTRARGAARALRNRWLLGNATYRCRGESGPVDTVYLGAFRRDELLAVGGYEEGLAANEDFELCARYRDTGRIVWLEDGMVVHYETRAGSAALFRQYHAFGRSKVRFWRLTGRRPNRRQQLALAAGVAATTVALASLSQPRRVAALAAAGVVAIAVVDHVAEPHERDIRVRTHASLASLAILGGWLAGVASGVVQSGRRLR